MTYLRDRKSQSAKRLRIAVISGAAIIIFASLVMGIFPHLLPGALSLASSPFWRAEFSIGAGALSSPASLLSENEELKRKLAEAEVRASSVEALYAENQELKAAMGRASSTPSILAAVLMRPPLAPYDEIVIDGGADLGFAVGNIVHAAGSVPIGKIAEVSGETSKVLLFSSPGEKYEVEIGASRASATAIGRGGGQYMAELPRDIPIKEGDAVTVPSLGLKMFGTVVSVVSDPATPFETVLFAPPVSIYGLRWVWVDRSMKKP